MDLLLINKVIPLLFFCTKDNLNILLQLLRHFTTCITWFNIQNTCILPTQCIYYMHHLLQHSEHPVFCQYSVFTTRITCFNIQNILYFAHTVYLRVRYDSHSK
jgi:hypothetical protein